MTDRQPDEPRVLSISMAKKLMAAAAWDSYSGRRGHDKPDGDIDALKAKALRGARDLMEAAAWAWPNRTIKFTAEPVDIEEDP